MAFGAKKKVVTIRPIADGVTNDWTPSAGNNYQNVDESPVDLDSSYNYSSTPGNIDLYTMQTLPGVTGTIYALGLNLGVRKTTGSSHDINPVFRSGGSNYLGNTGTVGGDFFLHKFVMANDPATRLGWTYEGVTGSQYGIRLTT